MAGGFALIASRDGVIQLAQADGGTLPVNTQPNFGPAPVSPLQGLVYVDPQNSTGNASPSGPGTITSPYLHWSDVINTFGSLEAVFSVFTNAIFLSNSPADGSDPVRWRPCATKGMVPQISGNRGAAQIVVSGNLAGVTGKSQVGAGALLTATLGAGVTLGMAVVNTTKNSLAWPVANTSGNTWTLTQPVPLLTPPHNNTSPGEDNTWTTGDAFTVYKQVAIDIVDLQPVIADSNSAFDNFLSVYACTILDTSTATGAGFLTVKASSVSFYECSIQRSLVESQQTPPQLLRNGLFNCDIDGAVVLCQPNVWSGQYRSTLSVGNFGGAGLQNDFVIGNSVELFTGGAYGTVFIATGKQLLASAVVVTASIGAPILYGPGGLNVQGCTRMTIPNAQTFAAVFQFTGAIQINGGTTALNGSPTAVPTASFTLTASNLDNGADFNGNAWVPGGGSITKLAA